MSNISYGDNTFPLLAVTIMTFYFLWLTDLTTNIFILYDNRLTYRYAFRLIGLLIGLIQIGLIYHLYPESRWYEDKTIVNAG